MLLTLLFFQIVAVSGNPFTTSPAVQSTMQFLLQATTEVFSSSDLGQVPYTVFISWETYNEGPDNHLSILMNQVLQSLEVQQIAVQLIYHKTVVIRRPRVNNIFFVDSLRAFEDVHASIYPEHYNFAGRYVIVVLDETGQDELLVARRILQLMWHYYVVNVNVLFGSLNHQEIHMYTYFPFYPGSCEKVKLVTWNTFKQGKFLLSKPHFPHKLHNFHGCPLSVALYTYAAFMRLREGSGPIVTGMEGIDAELLKHLSVTLNFTVIPLEVSNGLRFGLLYENGSATGAMQMIINGEVNFTLGFFGYNQLRMKYMSLTQNYHYSELVVVVTAGEQYEAFEMLLLPFSNTLWLVFLGCLGSAFFVIAIIGRMKRIVQRFVFGNSIQTPWLNLLNALCGGSLPILPSRNFARFLLMLWTLHALIIRTVYQQALFNFLQQSPNHSTITTLKQLIDGHYPIYVIPSEVYVFNNLPELQPQLGIIPAAKIQRFDDAIRRGQLRGARLSNYEKVLYDNSHFADGRYLQMLKQRLYNYPICVGLRKNSCLTKPFDDVLLELNPYGLVQAWISRYVNEKYAKVVAPVDERKQLTIRQLLGAFQLWVIALGGCSVVFCMELLCNYLAKRYY